MSDAVNSGKIHPQAYQAQIKLDGVVAKAAEESGLDPLLIELVKIRVSQLNGCAFCPRMLSRDALAKGETADRLAVVAAWWESQYFTAAEQSALALAEQVTKLGVPEDRRWDDGTLTDEQQSAVIWLTVAMNAWNRIAVASHYPVGP